MTDTVVREKILDCGLDLGLILGVCDAEESCSKQNIGGMEHERPFPRPIHSRQQVIADTKDRSDLKLHESVLRLFITVDGTKRLPEGMDPNSANE